MNYPTKMNAWAMEMALKLYAHQPNGNHTIEQLEADTKRLAAFAWTADGELQDSLSRMGDLIKASEDPLKLIEEIQNELNVAHEQIAYKIRAAQPTDAVGLGKIDTKADSIN